MKFTEERDSSLKYKQQYLDGIMALIEEKQKQSKVIRDEYIKDVFDPVKAEEYREQFKKMLGWPLCEPKDSSVPTPKLTLLSEEDGYNIYRAEFEFIDGVILSGLFFKLSTDEKRPLVIVQHGGLGTPELIAGFYEGGTGNYTDMLHRTLSRGVHVFAPQLLLWNENFGAAFNRNEIDARLKRVGSSITAIEIHAIMRILDYFETQSYVLNFGMLGLSYGGFYTLFTAAIDKRILSSVSCSFFNARDKVGWCDWTWRDSANTFDDAEVACLVYPRRISLQMGDKDKLFDSKASEESFEQIKKIAGASNVDTDWIELIVFDGVHEFIKTDEPIDRMINDLMKNK